MSALAHQEVSTLCPACGTRGAMQHSRLIGKQRIGFCNKDCWRDWQDKKNADWPAQHGPVAPEPATLSRYQADTRRRKRTTDSVPLAWQTPRPPKLHADPSALFKSVAGFHYDENPVEWDRALKLLNLRLCYQPAVAEVLQQGRWQTSKNPSAYIATAAYRRALALNLPYSADQVTEPDGTTTHFRVLASDASYAKDPGYGEDGAGNKITQEEHLSWVARQPVNATTYDPFLRSDLNELEVRHDAWERLRAEVSQLSAREKVIPIDQCVLEPKETPAERRKLEAVRAVNSWRAAIETDSDDGGDWTSRVPGWLRIESQGEWDAGIPGPVLAGWESSETFDSTAYVNWHKVAEVAISKPYMRKFVAKALHLRFDEFIGRDEAVQRECREVDKKAMSAAYQWIARNHEGRIRVVANSPSEAAARAALYGAPQKPLTPRERYTKASAVMDRLFARRDQLTQRDDRPGIVLDRVKYGW